MSVIQVPTKCSGCVPESEVLRHMHFSDLVFYAMQSGGQPCTALLTSPVAPFKVIDRDPSASLIIQDTSALILNSDSPQFWESGRRKPVISLDQAKTFDSWRVGCRVRSGGSVPQPRSLAEMWQILQDCLEPWACLGLMTMHLTQHMTQHL